MSFCLKNIQPSRLLRKRLLNGVFGEAAKVGDFFSTAFKVTG
jgi:hypothetical protein